MIAARFWRANGRLYDDLVEKGFDEKALTERLQKQHKTICAAIRAGRIEDLKEMTAKDSAARRKNSPVEKKSVSSQKTVSAVNNQIQLTPEQKPNGHSAPKIEHKIPPPVQVKQIPAEKPPIQTAVNGTNKVSVYAGNDSPIPKPKYDLSIKSVPAVVETVPQTVIAKTAPLMTEDELIIEAVEIIEDEMILPDEAVEIVTEAVEDKPADNKLKLQIIGDDGFQKRRKENDVNSRPSRRSGKRSERSAGDGQSSRCGVSPADLSRQNRFSTELPKFICKCHYLNKVAPRFSSKR